MNSSQDNLEKINSRLDDLENRLKNLENKFESKFEEDLIISDEELESMKYETPEEREERFETTIGMSWMALIGTVVIIAGLCFLLSLSYESLPPILPSVIGYFLTAGIFMFSLYLRKTYTTISKYLVGGSLLLFYFSTLRLHFFGYESAVSSIDFEILLLVIVVIVSVAISLRKNSIYLVSISLTLGFITSLVYANVLLLYLLVTLIAVMCSYLSLKYEWQKMTYYFMPLTYLTHLLWFMLHANENVEDAVPSIFINTLFVLIYTSIYFTNNLKRKVPFPETLGIGAFTLFNSGLAILIIFSIVNISKIDNSAPHYFLASAVFLVSAFITWEKEQSKYSTFVQAMTGYFALSLAIISLNIPNYLIWLSWQSLLVVATAVWFRSKFIVVANFFIYALVLLGYYFTIDEITLFALSFGAVALLSARILNWKKDQLELKTEQMRNFYLASAFLAIPYTLYFTVPENFVSISWIIVAVIYYSLSLVLNNKKYRWMSIFTFLLTLFYVAILGFTSKDTAYKIISFLALGLVLIVISIFYTKKKILNRPDNN